MTASIHKLTAGDGYQYLTRQVARGDRTHGPSSGLDDYYSEEGESPGRWFGKALPGLAAKGEQYAVPSGSVVRSEQMLALFGEGRHPNAAAIEKEAITQAAAAGKPVDAARKRALNASSLGRRFAQFDQASTFRTACGEAFAQANRDAGLPADWALPAQERAQIRTRIATKMFTEQHGRAPAAGELDRWIIRASKAPSAVAGYDVTFSPVKSVSTLWAVADREVAAVIATAHDDAVKDVLGWIESQVMFTREGRAGVRQVDTTGMLATVFTHRDSRSGDPDLHTHVAISNKVQTTSGRWLALDGRVLFKATVAASERYNTRLETLLAERLGVRFTERAQPDPRKRAVREVVGVPEDLCTLWSSRRVAIEGARDQLVEEFVATHGRHPTPVEMVKLAQQANLDTRDAKHEPRSEADQRTQWRREADQTLGADVVDSIVAATRVAGRSRTAEDVSAQDLAAAVVARLEESRSTWQVWHVRAEAERQVRAIDVDPAQVDALVEQVTAAAVGTGSVPLSARAEVEVPAELTRRDGLSVYEVAGSRLYTSPQILAAEERLIHAATLTDGMALATDTVNIALLESVANGLTLNPAQAQLVRDLGSSGRRLQLAIAPAGSGKTTAMRVLARAWTGSGGNVIGLAPTAVAGKGLGKEIDSTADTLASLTFALATGSGLPTWAAGVDERTLVVIDEAGMASTTDLDLAVSWCLERGASVRLVGDDQQLAAISAGGVLRDIATTAGVSTLSELVRFSDQAEAAATLALRAGDVTALGFYVDHGRVHLGAAQAVADGAYQAWTDATRDGVDAVMLGPTREVVRGLNLRAQADRLAADPARSTEAAALCDGTQAFVGDTVLTRLNKRVLKVTATDFVKNGDRWVVESVHADGSLGVRHLGSRRHIVLPQWYVSTATELGYASTVHGAQGITADACHVIANGSESRQLLYVAMTRGRHANHVWVTDETTQTDLHDLTRPSLLAPGSDLDVLAGIIARDDAQVSVTTAARELNDPTHQLTNLAAQLRDAVPALVEAATPTAAQQALDAAAEHLVPGLTGATAWDTLREKVLIAAAAEATSPADLLAAVVRERALTAAPTDEADTLPGMATPSSEDPDLGDVAAVLAARIALPVDKAHPWAYQVPETVATTPQAVQYLHELTARVDEVTATLRETAAAWTPQSAPGWARPVLDAAPALVADLAVWRAVHAVDDDDLRLLGGPAGGADGKSQRALLRELHTALPAHASQHDAWAAAAREINEALVADAHWPLIATKLDVLAQAGLPVAALMAEAAASGDLPLEMPASALWWRISRTVAPAALEADSSRIRPEWTSDLVALIGDGRTERLIADPGWSGVITAVGRAEAAGWSPAAVLGAALEYLHLDLPPAAGGTPMAVLARALSGRVSMLAKTSLEDPYADLPVDLTEPDEPEMPEPGWDDTPQPMWDAPVQHDTVDLVDDDYTDTIEDGLVDAMAALTAAEAERMITDLQHPVTPARLGRPRLTPQQQRVADLTAAAEQFFTEHLEDSWAGTYLRSRLPDGVDHTAASPGYAPAGWTSLTDHLRATHHATDDELVEAGLASVSSRGTLIDVFRDRLVLPVRDYHGLTRAFTARRNPDAPDDGKAGPKYLNTPETPLWRKSEHLYGAENLPRARPVAIAEGALDALAITLATEGTVTGVAPLGTAVTADHATLLNTVTGNGSIPVVVATDADTAGDKAADKAYTLLAEHDVRTARLNLPAGSDPAAHAVTVGADDLRARLANAQPLAHDIITRHGPATDWVEDRLAATRYAAKTIAHLPPEQWQPALEHALDRLGVAPETMYRLTADAATTHAHALRARRAAAPVPAAPARTPAPQAAQDLQHALDRLKAAQTPPTRSARPDLPPPVERPGHGPRL